jgi:hypothetical protein
MSLDPVVGQEAGQSPIATEPLLPGEVLHSDRRDDAEHWGAVYEELIAFLVRFDHPGETLERYRRRLHYWRRRGDELADHESPGRRSREVLR